MMTHDIIGGWNEVLEFSSIQTVENTPTLFMRLDSYAGSEIPTWTFT
jgi:hypothetical protein